MLKIIPVINLIIKNKRKEIKVIQEEFAKIINKSATTVKRYDTGDIIPENTLILICEKLNLDIDFLIKEQEEQNKLSGKKFYDDLIQKNHKRIIFKELDKMRKNKLLNIYSTFYDTDIDIKFKNNKYYIFDIFSEEIIIDIFTQEQARDFINDMQEYFEFKTERLRKEKLNK